MICPSVIEYDSVFSKKVKMYKKKKKRKKKPPKQQHVTLPITTKPTMTTTISAKLPSNKIAKTFACNMINITLCQGYCHLSTHG